MSRRLMQPPICGLGVVLALVAILAQGTSLAQGRGGDPPLDEVLRRVGAYVAGDGEQASLIVATEKYTQQVTAETGVAYRPRQVLAEFAIVRGAGAWNWIGFRDVVEVNGEPVTDRKDRLEKLLRDPSGSASEATRMSNESARSNIGPVSRNFNVPATTLFFLHPATQSRFSFSRRGTKIVDGVETWELSFKEARRPTLIVTRGGRDVPCEGTVWVLPADGTVVRTRLRLRGFADADTFRAVTEPGQKDRVPQLPLPGQPPPPQPPPMAPPATPAGPIDRQERVRLESLADIEVSYRRDERLGLWLPSKMSELYEGAIPRGGGVQPFLGRATSVATYSDFRRFETSIRITVPK